MTTPRFKQEADPAPSWVEASFEGFTVKHPEDMPYIAADCNGDVFAYTIPPHYLAPDLINDIAGIWVEADYDEFEAVYLGHIQNFNPEDAPLSVKYMARVNRGDDYV